MRFAILIAALAFASGAHAQSIDSIGGFPNPSGNAGGVLSGTYPNPGFAASPTFTGTTTVATFTATGAVTMSPASHNVTISPTGTGTVTLGPPAGQLVLANVSTGTNADFLCLSSGGVVLLQSSACTISSARFKHDIEAIAPSQSLATVLRLRPVSFVMNARNMDENGNRYQVGLTAENVASVDRELAIYEDDGVTPKSYRQEAVLAEVVGAIQALKAENDNLKRRISILESRGGAR